MANKALKGLTIKIGADNSELLDSLKDVEKKGKDLSSELGQINKLLKLDPTNTELLAQKQKVLADAISNTEDKLDTLKEAEKQAQEQFKEGKISEQQYRALQREVIATESKLDKYKQAVAETTEAEKRLADASDDVGQELDDQADKTRDADRAAEGLDDSAGSLAKGGLAAMAAAAAAAVTSIVALAESSREYRNEMSKLDVAFKDNGYSSEAATRTYEELQSILGETEQAVEAANHIAALAKNEEDLAKWTEIATGVYAKFGASLPIEGLTEAVNETIRVGQVTGPLADALNWATEEGEMFGLSLKKQVEFTKLTNAELKELTKKELEAYEAQERRYKNIEEWNQAILEAKGAEDLFNIALSECTNEQERQELITQYLTDTYSSAAAQFKKTNKEVIEANKATEKWNKATAKLGKSVEPVMTDIKELGVTLLEDMEEPLENIAEYIQDKVIPAIKSISKWVKSNMPAIKAGIVGITTAMVAFKVATVANTVAQKGLGGAIKATTVAQKALDLVMKASPWGLVLAGITAAAAALIAFTSSVDKAKAPVDALTKEERKLMEAADKAAEAFRDQKKATDETLSGIVGEMDHVKDLADELFTLADASGKVQEKDQARADIILGQLNEALGTEYEQVDGLIGGYKELKASIDELIQSKLANSLIEAANDDYVTATENVGAALENANNKLKDYNAQKEKVKNAEAEYAKWYEYYTEQMKTADATTAYSLQQTLIGKEEALNKEKKLLKDKETAYYDAAAVWGEYSDTINNYEAAQTAAAEGNYQAVVDLLVKKGSGFVEYSDKVDEETARVLDALYNEAVGAGQKAALMRQNFEAGVGNYTEEMVKEAEEGYQDALDAFGDAYADAELVGEDMGDGLTEGLEKKRSKLIKKGVSLVTDFLAAVRKTGDTHSPSRKTMAIGEDMGEGTVIGIENKTKDVKRAATNQAGAILDAYRSEEVNAQKALRHVAEQQSARQVNSQMAAAGSSGPLLEKILAAIEKGQILTIDGNALVGATANSMDSALGRRRALAARGAI